MTAPAPSLDVPATAAGPRLRCLNVDQPYAWAIAEGVKRYETRGSRTNHRGPLAIRSTKNLRPFWEIWDEGHQDHPGAAAGRIVQAMPLELDVLDDPPMPTGCVLAVVELVDCLPIVPLGEECAVRRIEVDYSGGLWLSEPDPEDAPGEGDTVDITDQLPWGDWRSGRHAYELADIRRLTEPIPAPGAMPGMFTLPADVDAAVREAAAL